MVIPFAVPVASPFFQCVSAPNEALLDDISVNPLQYYLNLQSTPSFAPGAIRGQLTK